MLFNTPEKQVSRCVTPSFSKGSLPFVCTNRLRPCVTGPSLISSSKLTRSNATRLCDYLAPAPLCAHSGAAHGTQDFVRRAAGLLMGNDFHEELDLVGADISGVVFDAPTKGGMRAFLARAICKACVFPCVGGAGGLPSCGARPPGELQPRQCFVRAHGGAQQHWRFRG